MRGDDICSGEAARKAPGIVLATEVNKRIDYTETNKRAAGCGGMVGQAKGVRPGFSIRLRGREGAKERRGDGPIVEKKIAEVLDGQ